VIFGNPKLEAHCSLTVLGRCAVDHNHCCMVTYLHGVADVVFNCPLSGREGVYNIIQRGTYAMRSSPIYSLIQTIQMFFYLRFGSLMLGRRSLEGKIAFITIAPIS